jgi:hypothetical protein
MIALPSASEVGARADPKSFWLTLPRPLQWWRSGQGARRKAVDAWLGDEVRVSDKLAQSVTAALVAQCAAGGWRRGCASRVPVLCGRPFCRLRCRSSKLAPWRQPLRRAGTGKVRVHGWERLRFKAQAFSGARMNLRRFARAPAAHPGASSRLAILAEDLAQGAGNFTHRYVRLTAGQDARQQILRAARRLG